MGSTIDNDETSSSQIGLSLLVTVEETETLLRVGRTTAYELVMRGTLQSVTIGRRRLVARRGLDHCVSGLLSTQVND